MHKNLICTKTLAAGEAMLCEFFTAELSIAGPICLEMARLCRIVPALGRNNVRAVNHSIMAIKS